MYGVTIFLNMSYPFAIGALRTSTPSTMVATRLAGVSRTPQGAPNPGFAGKNGGQRRRRRTVIRTVTHEI